MAFVMTVWEWLDYVERDICRAVRYINSTGKRALSTVLIVIEH